MYRSSGDMKKDYENRKKMRIEDKRDRTKERSRFKNLKIPVLITVGFTIGAVLIPKFLWGRVENRVCKLVEQFENKNFNTAIALSWDLLGSEDQEFDQDIICFISACSDSIMNKAHDGSEVAHYGHARFLLRRTALEIQKRCPEQYGGADTNTPPTPFYELISNQGAVASELFILSLEDEHKTIGQDFQKWLMENKILLPEIKKIELLKDETELNKRLKRLLESCKQD